MTEGEKGGRKLTRRDFLSLAAKGAVALGGTAVLTSCGPAGRALKEMAKTATVEAEIEKVRKDYQTAERATQEAPRVKWERKVEEIKAQKDALQEAVKADFNKRNSVWRIAGIEFVGGETNPLATQERQVFTQPPNSGEGKGLKVRVSPAVDGGEVAGLKDLTRLGEYRFRLEIRKSDGSGKSLWAAVEAQELSKYISPPPQPEPLLAKDGQGGEKKYYFYCLDEMGQSYTRELRTKP